jgi:hypothetical protein
MKSQDFRILIQLLSRYRTGSDVTKNAVTHIRKEYSIPVKSFKRLGQEGLMKGLVNGCQKAPA